MAGSNYPGYSGSTAARSVRPLQSGTSTPADPTEQPGQYPVGGWGDAIFGGPLPQGTGAAGSAGGQGSNGDPTAEPGQLTDSLTGIPGSGITASGAPGTQGAVPDLGGSGGTPVSFTRNGAAAGGTYNYETVTDQVTGPQDWTQANDDGYASGGPQLPGLKGNEPQAGGGRFQPGGGSVLRGGRAVRP